MMMLGGRGNGKSYQDEELFALRGARRAPIASADAEFTQIIQGNPTDVIYNGDGSQMYVARLDGKVSIYDTASGQVTATIKVGPQLAGMDISPDGSYLLVAEDTHSGATGNKHFAVYRIDLATLAVTQYSKLFTGNEGPFHDIAIFEDGTAIVTTKLRGSGATTTYTLDTGSGTFSPLASGSAEAPIVMASADRQHILLTNGFNVSGPNQVYSLAADGSIHLDASSGVSRSGHSLAAFAADGSLAAYVDQGVDVFDGQLNKITTVSGTDTADVFGVAFDATADYLYVLEGDGRDYFIDKVSTADWSVAARIGVDGLPISITNGYGSGETLTVGPDGQYFTYISGQGLYRIENPTAITPQEGSDGDNTLTGTSGADILHGNGGADLLLGGGGDDILRGGPGKDRLDGGTGHDAMYGGDGNDTYIVDDVRDVVGEASAGGGTDTVMTSVSFTLGANLETLILVGKHDIDATGNELANVITGNSGDNIITGGLGADSVSGGGGADIFAFGNAAEIDAGGDDTILDFSGSSAGGEKDKIDLSAIARFTFIGSAKFDGDGPEVRVTANKHGSYVVRGDMDGDGDQDFSFTVHSGAPPTANDFSGLAMASAHSGIAGLDIATLSGSYLGHGEAHFVGMAIV